MAMLALVSISIYILLNTVVTLTNKILVSRIGCPYTLTLIHAASSYISISILSNPQGSTSSQHHALLQSPYRLKLLAFSLLFTINIAVSNLTLSLVSLPVHQTMRAVAPALTVLSMLLFQFRTPASYGCGTYFSLLPIMAGVVLAAHSETVFSPYNTTAYLDLIATLFGAVLAVLKTILTYQLQTTYGIKSVDLIKVTAPLAAGESLLLAWVYGEFPRLVKLFQGQSRIRNGYADPTYIMILSLLNALLAALLNLSSFEANKRCGPVSMGVAANIKQVAVFALSIGKYRTVKQMWEVLAGTLLTVVGGIWYAFAQRKNDETRQGGRDSFREGIELTEVGGRNDPERLG